MPYYVHSKATEDFAKRMDDGDLYGGEFPAYPTKVDARAACSAESTITFVMSGEDWRAVQARWTDRCDSGEVYDCPWGSTGVGIEDNWYPHLRFDAPGKVHFYASSEHVYLDRVTLITPGRYLNRYLKDVISPAQIKEWIAEVSAADAELCFATTERDIHLIYNTSAVGFSSCMQRKRHGPEYDWQKHMDDGTINLHPAHIYAAPDLAVAYRGPLNAPKQRAVVWPAEKTYQRIYGDGPLVALLKRAGYQQRGIIGARVLRKDHPIDGYVMPYVDGVSSCSLDTDPRYIVLDDDGNLDCQQTTGSTENCPPEVEQGTCEHCGHEGPYDEMYGDYCASCEDERWRCDHCRATCFADENGGSTDAGDSLCESCFDDYETERQEREDAEAEEEAQAERDRVAAEAQETETENRTNDDANV